MRTARRFFALAVFGAVAGWQARDADAGAPSGRRKMLDDLEAETEK